MPEEIKKEEKSEEAVPVDVEKVQAVLAKLRPYLQYDGGDIALAKVENGYVYVKMYGACMGCLAIGETLNGGVEAMLKEEVPGVKGVVLVDPFNDSQPLEI